MVCIIAVSVVCLGAMTTESESLNKEKCVSIKDINKFKKGWQQLFPNQCPKTIRTYANKGWFVFINDIITTNEGVFISRFASQCGLELDIEYCDFIWPFKTENIKYTGKIFLFIKEESIKKFNEHFNFELQWQKSSNEIII